MAGHLAVEHRLDEGPEQQGVVGGDEVDRPAHDDDPHDAPFPQQRGQVVGDEAVEPRPQPEVRVQRYLGLHADEVVDGVERRAAGALEEQLAGQRRPVQGARRQDIGGHAAILTDRRGQGPGTLVRS